MSEERDFDYVVGKLPRKDKDGNDTTGDRIGKGGRHRGDGTYSAVAYDLEVVDEDPTKVVPPEPQVIVRREVVEVEKRPTRYEDLPWYQQLIVDGIKQALPIIVDRAVDGAFYWVGRGWNAAVNITDGRAMLDKLSSPLMLENINTILKNNPVLLETWQTIALEDILGRELIVDSCYVPIEGQALRKNLMSLSV